MKSLKTRFGLYIIAFFGFWMFMIFSESCNIEKEGNKIKIEKKVSEAEVIAAQKAWGVGVIGIGVAYASGGDYREMAKQHVEKFYGYDLGKVLFKPTMAAEKQFRQTYDGALSYFIGDNPAFPEDKGFALNRWTDVRFENAGIINSDSDLAIAMGNYYFTDESGQEMKVEFTICYRKNDQGDLKIIAHKSSLPYTVET